MLGSFDLLLNKRISFSPNTTESAPDSPSLRTPVDQPSPESCSQPAYGVTRPAGMALTGHCGNAQIPLGLTIAYPYVGYWDGIGAGQTIAEIEYLERIFAVPDIRRLGPSDLAAANGRPDDMLAQSPWFRLWQRVWPLRPRRLPSNPARGNRKLEFHQNSNTPSSVSTFQ